MVANPRAEELESECAPAPQLAVVPPFSEPSADTERGEAAADPDIPPESAADPGAESRHEAVARAAYFLAQARGFAPGHELDDWLVAEQQVSPH